MFGKLAVRNIAQEIWQGLELLAQRHERSTEAEARYALRAWVEPHLKQQERSARRVQVAARLRELLDQTNEVLRVTKIKPSHIAQEIGKDYAEDVESWFTGEKEPAFKDLELIATFLGGTREWLQHGDGKMFPINGGARIPEDPVEGTAWLLDLKEREKVTYLHIVRDADETGTLAIIKQYGKWRCKTYITPYHVSDQIGNGGESSLSHLSLILLMLYKYYVRSKRNDLVIKSYLLPDKDFSAICSGNTHPLAALNSSGKEAPWWEDFWDISQFKRHNYWPGWTSICERIYNVVESKPDMKQSRELIQSEKHPFLTDWPSETPSV